MDSNSLEKDREIITAIVKEMAGSMTGEQSTRHWIEDTHTSAPKGTDEWDGKIISE